MLTISAPIYTIRHSASISTTEVLIEIRIASTALVLPLYAWCNAESDETNVQLPFRIGYYDAQGATGTGLEEDPHQGGFAAMQSTAFYAPGTDPTTLLETWDEQGCAVIGPGYQWDGAGGSYIGGVSQSIALELLAAPPAAVTLKFGMRVAELRGN